LKKITVKGKFATDNYRAANCVAKALQTTVLSEKKREKERERE